ncbi:hypothetical protein EUGRSUZ_E01611 [Eucalyptus grandis]|uniref:Uncharacterized protein n=2 Tax=Eucalyptus grandis TaxID=71139 RepID=A0ACC3KUS3_EUCGR|nr:hypothetical protein EUGRSUZ_E01611 [Eucalyptus grandis]
MVCTCFHSGLKTCSMNTGSLDTWNQKTEKEELKQRIKSHFSLKQNPRRCDQNVWSNGREVGYLEEFTFQPIQHIKVKAVKFTCII